MAVQCLETAFEVSTDDQSLAVPMTLEEMFSSATAQVRTKTLLLDLFLDLDDSD